ncbi:hypothetical protein D9611_011139 [Ephemerocybe angulata]|uniref:DUF6699 domain-containing protein n=1 Tax=Ephemerocybe angulata TaxID=980116 RepID=A0A8H5CC51_9AGAR|nr:hypothetical protein D9611_011139 [Tulosesus angulatus]
MNTPRSINSPGQFNLVSSCFNHHYEHSNHNTMTGFFKKKVRFSRTSTVHLPATPQLYRSRSDSPASSLGPITPPSASIGLPGPTPYAYGYYGAPYDGAHAVVPGKYQAAPPAPPPARLPLAPVQPIRVAPSSSNSPHSSSSHNSRGSSSSSSQRFAIHRYLELASSHPAIVYNLLDHPSMAARHHYTLSPAVLAEPATSPALSSLTVKMPTSLPSAWDLQVAPRANGSFVTLGDVLEQLYAQLRVNINQRDFDHLRSSAERKEATAAYERRYRRYRAQDAYTREKKGGMKRVDFLRGKTVFLGLGRGKRSGVWILNTG